MSKILFRSFLLILIISIILIIFLSYFGIETTKFNDLIKTKANESHKYVKLEFQKTKIYLNPKELNLVVKLQKPKIKIKNNEIILSKLNLFLALRAFLTSDFLLERAQIAFFENDIQDLTKITRLFLPKIINKQLKKIFKEGNLEGEFIIPFTSDGSMAKDYKFSGRVIDATINLPKGFLINNLTTEINFGKGNEGFTAKIDKGFLFDLNLVGTTLNFKFDDNKTKVKTLIHTNGKINFSQIKKISSILGLQIGFFNDIEGKADIKTSIDFDLDKRFKLKNLLYSLEGNIEKATIVTEGKRTIKKYFPEYDSKIVLKNSDIKFFNSKSDLVGELNGLVKIKDNFDNFKITKKYNYKAKQFNLNGFLELTNSKVHVARLNYNKDPGKEAKINFDLNFIFKKKYKIKEINFSDGKSNIYLSNIKLNNNFKVVDFKDIKIKTFSDELKNNDFTIFKKEKITILGEVFDLQPFLKSLYKKSDKKIFSKNFDSEIKLNFNRAITGTNDDLSNLSMIASINEGSYNKLSLKGNFSTSEIVEMSIYQIDKDKKTLQLISDRARPFIKNFNFIKGFEDGKLEYESTITKENTNSNLLIRDFKVSKVPALAKLLTLASLQGIADTLSGEGIRFDSFEMKSYSKGNVMNIEDALAMGPAVSILLNGYVDKGKIVSLRGTLVPATKLNSIIASIPLVGDILVGKKTGEGVVGVSFKMKGPPKDIKTTVNPIKTLTPRFIVRAVEKMKKKKQEESK